MSKTKVKIDEKISFDKIPPQSLEAEMGVLGAMLLDSDAISEVADIVSRDNGIFYKDAHQKIYSAILHLNSEGKPVDAITLMEELNTRNELENIGGVSYLNELTKQVSSAANIRAHAKIVFEKSVLRRLITAGTIIAREGYEGKETAKDLLNFAESKIFEIAEQKSSKPFMKIEEGLDKVIHQIQIFSKRGESVTGVSTGFTELDKKLSGFQKSDLVILAARPSMGKTALALNFALNAARNGVSVGFFSIEMATQQLILRLLAMETQINQNKLRDGKLFGEEWQKLGEKSEKLSKLSFLIDDTPGLDILELRSKARQMKMRYNVGVLFIDYLQLINGPKSENRQNEISAISRSLKGLAKELDIPVIALSQLSRAVENRTDKTPMLSDLRESGAIEQDADVVMFLHRDEYYNSETAIKGLSEIIIGKQRNGPIGKEELMFLGEFGLFRNKDKVFSDNAMQNPHDNDPKAKVKQRGEMKKRAKKSNEQEEPDENEVGF